MKNKILEKYSKVLRLDLKYFIENGWWLLISYSISIMSGLLISVILTRNISSSDYGLYQFCLSIIGTLSIFSLSGMKNALLQSTANNYENLKCVTKIRLKYSLIGSLTLLGLSLYLKYETNVFWNTFLFLSFIFPFIYSFDCYTPYLIGKKDFKKNTKYSILYQIIVLLVIFLATNFIKQISYIIIIYFLSIGLIHCVYYITLVGNSKNQTCNPETISYGKELTGIEFISTVAMHIDKLIITFWLGLENLAIYSIALVIPESVKNFIKNLAPLSFSKLIGVEKHKIVTFIKEKSFLITLLSGILVIPGVFVIPSVILFLFGENYAGAIFFSQIFFLTLLIAPFSNLFVTYLTSQKESFKLLQYNMITSCSQIILLLLFIPTLGIWGAILGKSLAKIIGLITLIKLTKIN